MADGQAARQDAVTGHISTARVHACLLSMPSRPPRPPEPALAVQRVERQGRLPVPRRLDIVTVAQGVARQRALGPVLMQVRRSGSDVMMGVGIRGIGVRRSCSSQLLWEAKPPPHTAAAAAAAPPAVPHLALRCPLRSQACR